MVFHVVIFIFCLETTLRDNNWMRATYVALIVVFYSKVSFQKNLITAMLKVLSQQLLRTLRGAFERHLAIEDFTDMDQHRCQASYLLPSFSIITLEWMFLLKSLDHNLE